MFHTIITTLLHWFCLGAILPIYSIYASQYLDFKELILLFVEAIMFASLMLPGWIMHCIRLILFTIFSLLCLDICIGEYEEFVGRYEVSGQADIRGNKMYKKIQGKEIFMVSRLRTLRKFKLKETFVIGVVVALWILIKICYTKAHSFGIGLDLPDGTKFMGFAETLDGWNCNYPEFTFIACFNLSIMVVCFFLLSNIINTAFSDTSLSDEEKTDINSYKLYLRRYLILPSLLAFWIDFTFNLYSHSLSQGMLACYQFFKYGILIYALMVIAVPLSSRLFFYKKSGRFSLQSERISGGSGSGKELGEPLRMSSA